MIMAVDHLITAGNVVDDSTCHCRDSLSTHSFDGVVFCLLVIQFVLSGALGLMTRVQKYSLN